MVIVGSPGEERSKKSWKGGSVQGLGKGLDAVKVGKGESQTLRLTACIEGGAMEWEKGGLNKGPGCRLKPWLFGTNRGFSLGRGIRAWVGRRKNFNESA